MAKANILKALGHPTRLWMAEQLADGEKCVCELGEFIDATGGSGYRRIAHWGCTPEPQEILSGNIRSARFPASTLIRHGFPCMFCLVRSNAYGKPSAASENIYLTSNRAIADFARMPEISRVPAYTPTYVEKLRLKCHGLETAALRWQQRNDLMENLRIVPLDKKAVAVLSLMKRSRSSSSSTSFTVAEIMKPS